MAQSDEMNLCVTAIPLNLSVSVFLFRIVKEPVRTVRLKETWCPCDGQTLKAVTLVFSFLLLNTVTHFNFQ